MHYFWKILQYTWKHFWRVRSTILLAIWSSWKLEFESRIGHFSPNRRNIYNLHWNWDVKFPVKWYRNNYNGNGCKLEIWPNLVAPKWLLSLWRTSTSSVPDSLNQAATTAPVDINLPILHLAIWNGAPMLVSRPSIARFRAPSPVILLCLPQPVKMLQRTV